MKKAFSDRFFTVTELLTIIGIVCIILTLLLPVVVDKISYARLKVCSDQQHVIGLAITFYAHDNSGFIPDNIAGNQDDSTVVLRMPGGTAVALGRLLDCYLDNPELFGCPDSPGFDDLQVKASWNASGSVWSSYLYRACNNNFDPHLQSPNNIDRAMLMDLATSNAGQRIFAPHQYLYSNILYSDCHVESRCNSRIPFEFYTLDSIRPDGIVRNSQMLWQRADNRQEYFFNR